MLERSKIKELVESAPASAKRETGPDILVANQIGEKRMIKISWMDFDELMMDYLADFESSAARGEIGVVHINSREFLEQAITSPKHALNRHVTWATDVIDKMVKIPERQIFRERERLFDQVWEFRHNADDWKKEVFSAMESGSMWEFGIIIRDSQSRFVTLSISNPWDGSRQPVHKLLTPEDIFIGREDLLEETTIAMTGKTQKQLNVEKLLNSDSDMAWRDELKISGREQQVRGWDFRRKQFRDLIADEISKRLGVGLKQVFDFMNDAADIRGYYITASKGDLPGTIQGRLHIDYRNWLKLTAKNKNETKTDKLVEVNDPEVWCEGSGCLFNSSNDLSVCLVMQERISDNTGKTVTDSTGVRNLEITRKFVGKDGKEKRVIYCLNHPIFGDSYQYVEGFRLPREENAVQISKTQMERLISFFNVSVERGKVDSHTRIWEKQTEGLTERTLTILGNARKLIEDKARNFGIRF